MLGIVHFLAKPFSLVELTGLLRNLTQNSGPEDFS
jgi:DNA-binding response OmpR family regulator